MTGNYKNNKIGVFLGYAEKELCLKFLNQLHAHSWTSAGLIY